MTKEQILEKHYKEMMAANPDEWLSWEVQHKESKDISCRAMDEWAAIQHKVLIDALKGIQDKIRRWKQDNGGNNLTAHIDAMAAAALASYVEQAPQERRKGPWKWKDHFYQIANAGDYDGFYEITNGTVSILTKDCVEAEVMEEIVDVLNASELNFYQDDSSHFVAQHFETENKELRKEIEKLEGQVTGKSAGKADWFVNTIHPEDETRVFLWFPDNGNMNIGYYSEDDQCWHWQEYGEYVQQSDLRKDRVFYWTYPLGEAGKQPEQQPVGEKEGE